MLIEAVMTNISAWRNQLKMILNDFFPIIMDGNDDE